MWRPAHVEKIATIIPHYNDVTRLARCLQALMPQLGDADQLVVVDNGSTEDLAPVQTRWPGLKLVREERKGAACARNRGVAETDAPWLLFLDSDCVPAKDWLAAARALSANPPGDLIGGRVGVFDETPPPRSGAEAYETVFGFPNQYYIEVKGFSVTANLLTRRDVFAATGPLRNGMSEDVDWCNRARAKGFQIAYAEALCVSHPTRSDWAALVRKWHRLTAEGYHLRVSPSGGRARWLFKALAMPLSVIPHGVRFFTHPDLRNGGERLRGLATLAQLRVMRMVWMLRALKLGDRNQ